MEIKKEISYCFHGCPFFKTEGMERMMMCGHPFWDDKEPYAGAIITHENSKDGKFPELCPLKIQELKITYKLK